MVFMVEVLDYFLNPKCPQISKTLLRTSKSSKPSKTLSQASQSAANGSGGRDVLVHVLHAERGLPSTTPGKEREKACEIQQQVGE